MKTNLTPFKTLVFTLVLLIGQQISFSQTPEKQLIKYKSEPIVEEAALVNEDDYSIHKMGMVAPNFQTPASQVECIYFAAVPQGSFDPVAYVYFDFRLYDNTTGDLVFSDSFVYSGLTKVCIDHVHIPGCYTPPPTPNTYTGIYYFTTDIEEENILNNYDTIHFEITENTFAKENGPTQVVIPNASSWEGELEPHSWAFGNHYYIVNGSDHPENYGAESVTFSLGNANAPDIVGKLISIYLYKWDTDTYEDGHMYPNERTRVGFYVHEIKGTELPTDLITVPLFKFPTGEPGPVDIESNQDYVVMIEYVTNDTIDFALVANDKFQYWVTEKISEELGEPRYGELLGINGNLESEPYSSLGFSNNLVPIARLNLSSEDIIENTVKILPPENRIQLSPNPANSFLNVEIELVDMQKEATVRIFDLKGRLLAEKRFENIKNERTDFDVSKFPAGNYFLQFVSEAGTRAETFEVIR